jgi:hypothetical protein
MDNNNNMSDSKDNEKPEECEGIRQARATDKEIKAILKEISAMSGDNKVNANSLTHLAESFKELATANSLTHYKLFSRTENLSIGLKGIETKHGEHVKHGGLIMATGRYKHVILVSWAAIGISLAATIVFGLIQAGVFK